jgi:hypothetical protein
MDFLKAHGFSIQSPAFGIATAFTAQYGWVLPGSEFLVCLTR